MKIFLRLFRYVLRYKRYLFLSIILGFLTSSLNIFNIFAFQPILEVMFTSETEIKAKAAEKETEENKEEKKVKLPIVRTIEKKIKPYRDALDDRMEELTEWAIHNKMKAIYLIAIIVLASALLKSLTAYGSDFLMIYMGLSLIRDIRQEVHDHILKMDLTFFAKRTTGQLLSRSSNDVAALNSSIISLVDVGIQSPLTIILTLLLMYYLSPNLTIYAFFLVPVAIIFIATFGRRIRKISKQAQKRIADVLDVMQETYNAIRVVKAFGMEEFESKRFRNVNERANKTYLKRQAVKKIISPLMEFLGVAAAVLVPMAGAHLIIRENILTGTKFFIFLFAASRLYRPIKDLSGIHLEIQSGLAGAERVFEILDTRQNLTEKPGAAPLSPVKDRISFNQVSFHYENSSYHALEEITIDIPRGSVFALVGRSGAGKTTFANLLCRFYDPTSGGIAIDGKDLRDVTLQSLRDRIAIVTQETILFNDTIKNNIAYGRKDIPIESIIDAAQKAYADEFILNLPQGYDTPIGQQGGRLSGGQRQRIAIARAILKNPDILVFDEATSSLDSEAEQKIQQAMQNLIKGRTTLIIAHRLSTVKMADRILVLDSGKLIEQGNHEELLKQNGEYAKLCHLQGIFIDAENTVDSS
jgi:subfamily B ATP-binding cassette protein MsbA